ncbi:MAG: hypothetical protein EOL98_08395 [Negativicutes bacterium]|nr:hypothetical protein [Negativicutes bacterium]
MLTKKSSLSFSQSTRSLSKPFDLNSFNPSNVSFGIQTANTFSTVNVTNNFNQEFGGIYKELNKLRNEYQQNVNDLLNSGSIQNDAFRDKGVELAWKYEKAELQMDGDGTRAWSQDQRQEIFEKGRVRNFEGHHINSVGDNPSQQANPDNVEFLEEHRKGAGTREHFDKHGRNWRNQTEGDLIDRNDRIKGANEKRVLKNELAGIGAAVAIGLGVGFTLGFVITLAQSGITTETVKNASIAGARTGVEGAILGAANHLVVRGVGDMANRALQGVATNLGLTITENMAKMCNMAVFGSLAIIVFSSYQFVKLKIAGYSTKECLLRVGKSAAFSASILLLSIAAQGVWGGHAGIIVSTSIGVIFITYKMVENKHTRKINEMVQHYTIQKCEPVIAR